MKKKIKKYWHKLIDKIYTYFLKGLFEECPICLGKGFVYGYIDHSMYWNYQRMSERIKNWNYENSTKIEQRECHYCKGNTIVLTNFGTKLLYLLKLCWDDVKTEKEQKEKLNEMK